VNMEHLTFQEKLRGLDYSHAWRWGWGEVSDAICRHHQENNTEDHLQDVIEEILTCKFDLRNKE
jgi:hypothetical protein